MLEVMILALNVLFRWERASAFFSVFPRRSNKRWHKVIDMQTITYSQVQELVASLPSAKLPLAHRFLSDLIPESIEAPPPREELMALPLNERRRLLSKQAADLVEHYSRTQDDREVWQGGDIEDY